MPKQKPQAAQNQRVLAQAQANIGKRFGRNVGHQTHPSLGGMSSQRRSTGEKGRD